MKDFDELEARDLARLKSGELRMVCAQRARKIRRSGRSVWWSHGLRSWVWTPPWFAPKAKGEAP